MAMTAVAGGSASVDSETDATCHHHTPPAPKGILGTPFQVIPFPVCPPKMVGIHPAFSLCKSDSQKPHLFVFTGAKSLKELDLSCKMHLLSPPRGSQETKGDGASCDEDTTHGGFSAKDNAIVWIFHGCLTKPRLLWSRVASWTTSLTSDFSWPPWPDSISPTPESAAWVRSDAGSPAVAMQ